MLKIRVTRVSPTHHKLAYTREDGTGEESELETKSFLFHDFIHFCIESEAKLDGGFFGLLEKGYRYSELASPEESRVALDVERVAGAFTAVAKGNATPKELMAGLQNLYDAYKEPLPVWLTEDFIIRAFDRYRRLMGEWGSLPFGESLELTFETQGV